MFGPFRKASQLKAEVKRLEKHIRDLERIGKIFTKEKSVDDSEIGYKSIFQNMPYIVFTVDTNGRLLDFNKAAIEALHRISGEDLKKYIGKHFKDLKFLDKGELKKAQAELECALRGTLGKQVVYQVKGAYGDINFVELATVPLHKEGQVVKVLCIGKDITENVLAQNQLKRSEEHFKTLFEFAPDPYYMHDLNGIFIDGNKASEELTGYSRAELIGKNFLESKLLSADQMSRAALLLAQNVLGRPTGPDEFMLCRKDGSLINVEINTHPIRIKDRIVVLGMARDISRRKTVEVALRESERNYRAIFDASNDALFVHDSTKGTIVDVNKMAEEMTGYSRRELKSLKVEDFSSGIEPYTNEKALEYIKMAGKGETQSFEWQIKNKKGQLIWVEVMLKSLDLGGIRRVLANVRDITERKEAEKAMKKHLRELEIYHESSIGREERILQLKEEVKELKKNPGNRS